MGRRSHHGRGHHVHRHHRESAPPAHASPPARPAPKVDAPSFAPQVEAPSFAPQVEAPSSASQVDVPSAGISSASALLPAPLIAAAVPPPPAALDATAVSASSQITSNGEQLPAGDTASAGSGATASQLRRFIKSRAYVPMHELRRRFAINGTEDDVCPVMVDGVRVYVGLPAREGMMLGDLFRQGDVGYELSLDPVTPIVVGVFPMRPVARH